jgi:hypothetical protein
LDVDLSGIATEDVAIKRYGQAIFSLDTSILRQELKRIQTRYPVFLNGALDDPGTIERMYGFLTDELLIEAYQASDSVFEKLDWLEEKFAQSFRYLRYHFPEIANPVVYSYVSGYDVEHNVQFYNNNLIIALDMYLGQDYPLYQKLGVPLYVIRRFDAPYIVRDCFYEIGRTQLPHRQAGGQLLDAMLREGRLLWFVRAMNPFMEDTILFNYTPEQLDWAQKAEGLVWAFLIENDALYASTPEFYQKFIMDAPFTSYFGAESPPRLGHYLGYRIIHGFMEENPDVSLQDLLFEGDARLILKKSRYKPDY